MSNQTFPIAQILSITTSRLCCDMGGVYEILNFVTGDNLFTHVLPRACHADKWLSLDPIGELAGMVGKEKIVILHK